MLFSLMNMWSSIHKMKRRFLLSLCLFLCFYTEAISQHSIGNSIFFGDNNRYNTIYTCADSLKDTIQSVVFKDRLPNECTSRAVVVLKEVGLGALLGTFFSLPGGLIGAKVSGERGWGAIGPAIIGWYVGYTFGISYGVYLVAKSEKPELTFFETVTSGIIGAGLGICILQASKPVPKGILSLAPIILPLAFPIIYVELIK